MSPSRLASLVALVATAAALAACGSSSTGPTTTDARAAYAPLEARIVGVGADIGPAIEQAPKETDVVVATHFAALAARGRAQKAAIEALKVPADLTAERDALRDALAKGVGDLADIGTASTAHDDAAAQIAVEKLVADSKLIHSTRVAFEHALYKAAT
jgi:hypothetical protein